VSPARRVTGDGHVTVSDADCRPLLVRRASVRFSIGWGWHESEQAVEVNIIRLDGFEVVELANDLVRVAVLPELGAKVISLLYVPTGRQWMWKLARQPQFWRSAPGTPFEKNPLAGADECLPTIAACTWRELRLPDHGEVWSEAWELDHDALAEHRLVTRLELPISPLWIERCVTLADGVVRFDYQLRNLSDQPFEYLWAFHPLLRLVPGDRLALPAGCRTLYTEVCLGDCPLGVRGDKWSWPEPLPGIDLARFDLGGDGRAVKLYTEPLREGMAAIRNETTGEALTFRFDPKQLDTLGIWINQRGLNGWDDVAIEPTNAAPDALDRAVNEWKRHGSLSPGETRPWSFSIELSGS
jgi:hypothetical protein